MISKTHRVKDWYRKTFPTDNRWECIDGNVTFSQLNKKRSSIDKMIGVSDSIVVNRVKKAVEYIFD